MISGLLASIVNVVVLNHMTASCTVPNADSGSRHTVNVVVGGANPLGDVLVSSAGDFNAADDVIVGGFDVFD